MDDALLAETVARIEQRLARLENYLELPPLAASVSSGEEPVEPAPAAAAGEELIMSSARTGLRAWAAWR